MPSVKRLVRFLDIVGPDQQIRSVNARIHSAGVVGPDHRFNADFIENALGDLGIRGGPKGGNGDQV